MLIFTACALPIVFLLRVNTDKAAAPSLPPSEH
jgi:hypothetical protein